MSYGFDVADGYRLMGGYAGRILKGEKLAREPGGGLIFPPDFSTSTHRHLIVEMAARYRLPAVYSG
jgi:hypothetical protein